MKGSNREMPIFTRTYDFLAWLTPLSNHFPRVHRQTITRRLLDAALDFQEAILMANSLRGEERAAWLRHADGHMDKVRLYLRLVHRLQWINMGQYEHGARMVAEIGRLLGGWIRATG